MLLNQDLAEDLIQINYDVKVSLKWMYPTILQIQEPVTGSVYSFPDMKQLHDSIMRKINKTKDMPPITASSFTLKFPLNAE